MVEVEHGIEYVPAKGGRPTEYPWDTLGMKDSFLAKGKKLASISVLACRRARMDGRKYSCKTVPGGIRVWRIA